MDDVVRNQLRLPSQLHNKLRELAALSGRSLNAEIVFRLTASIEGGGATAEPVYSSGYSTKDLAERLSRPEYRSELEAVVAAINRVMREDL